MITDALKAQMRPIMFPKPIRKVKNAPKMAYKGKKRKKPPKGYKLLRSLKDLDLPKEKTRSQLIKDLDKLFSDHIKKQYNGVCVHCGRKAKNMGVSHYYSRRYLGTRWLEENCCWACWGCHFYDMEKKKTPGEWYHEYMFRSLGKKGFEKLKIKALAVNKFSTNDIKLLIMKYETQI